MKNSDDKSSASFRQLVWIMGGAFALCGLGLIVLAVAFGADPSEPEVSQMPDALTHQAPADPAPSVADVGYRIWKKKAPSERAAPRGASSTRKAPKSGRRVVMRPDILEASASAADAGPDDLAPAAAGWSDPVNQRVLGPKAWMARVPEAERQAIERRLDTPIPERYPIDLRVREWSVDIVAEVVQGCFGEAEPSGRFAVNYTLVADGTRAAFEGVNLSNLYEIEDPTLVDCIVLNLSQRSFRSSEQGRMEVRQPFLFE